MSFTIKDVVNLAGASKTTVSRVMDNNPKKIEGKGGDVKKKRNLVL